MADKDFAFRGNGAILTFGSSLSEYDPGVDELRPLFEFDWIDGGYVSLEIDDDNLMSDQAIAVIDSNTGLVTAAYQAYDGAIYAVQIDP